MMVVMVKLGGDGESHGSDNSDGDGGGDDGGNGEGEAGW